MQQTTIPKIRGLDSDWIGRGSKYFEFMMQPAKSPDLNMLDLGCWCSLTCDFLNVEEGEDGDDEGEEQEQERKTNNENSRTNTPPPTSLTKKKLAEKLPTKAFSVQAVQTSCTSMHLRGSEIGADKTTARIKDKRTRHSKALATVKKGEVRRMGGGVEGPVR